MEITITHCRYTPKWETLQTVIREATNDESATLTRIRREDGGCGYREPGVYNLGVRRDNQTILPIKLTIVAVGKTVEDYRMTIENLKVEYVPGGRGTMGSFSVHADTPRGPYVLERELPQEMQSEDGLDWVETLNGEEVEGPDLEVEGPDFDPPYTEGNGARLYAERAEELVREELEKWLQTLD